MSLRSVRLACLLLVVSWGQVGCNPSRSQAWQNARKPAPGGSEQAQIAEVARAITELDVQAASLWLDQIVSREPIVPLLRARLALSLGDCQGASSLLATGMNRSGVELEMQRVADGCARAMAGAEVVVDEARGVWIRLQNPRDRVLVPLIVDVADRAAIAIGQHLHTQLPRPLRIELVSDLTTLAYLTGLPLEAAETTGTVAIARWGKVTMLSPRATREGFPWQDTLAHELAHLTVSRLSGDEAPLWLQEGIAKREETAWRSPRPLDDPAFARRLARRALVEGRSVGLRQLGASIALQPSPMAAATAYAEVQSFLEFWLEHSGDAALWLLLRDLRGLGGQATDRVLQSVTGYSLDEWIRRWQSELLNEATEANDVPAIAAPGASAEPPVTEGTLDELRRLRLGVLLSGRRHWTTATEVLSLTQPQGLVEPEVRWRWALAESMRGRWQAAQAAIGKVASLRHLDGAWLAQYGRVAQQFGQFSVAEQAFEQSLSFAPTLERPACRGEARSDHDEAAGVAILPTFEPFRSLCLDVVGTGSP